MSLFRIYFALLLLLLWKQPVSAETVVITTGETPPHTSQSNKNFGYINHIISTAFGKQGIEVEFLFMPWSRSYQQTAQGNFVATSYWYKDEKHQDKFMFSDVLSLDRLLLFRRKAESTPQWRTFSDAKRLKLKFGLTRGYTYTQEIWDYQKQRPELFSIVNTDKQNLRMLLLSRIDVFPAEEITGWYALHQHFSREQLRVIDTSPTPLKTNQSHLLFSRAHPEAERLLQEFNKGLEKLKREGTLNKYKDDFLKGVY